MKIDNYKRQDACFISLKEMPFDQIYTEIQEIVFYEGEFLEKIISSLDFYSQFKEQLEFKFFLRVGSEI